MAEWLRPRISIAKNGLNIRRISVGLISCLSKKSIGWAVGINSCPVVTMAGFDQIRGGRMAEWLRQVDCEVLTIKLRGINYQVAHLVSKSRPYITSRWFQSRPRFYMAPASADVFDGSRMAEWLRQVD
jgi:hypothetical protein